MIVCLKGWNDNANGVRLAICNDVIDIMICYFKIDYIKQYPLTLQHISCSELYCQHDFPCTHPDRSLICLTVFDYDWCKFVFQLSHELCHCSTSRKNLPQNIKWFDEFLCCFSSWVVINHYIKNVMPSSSEMFGNVKSTQDAFYYYYNLLLNQDNHIYDVFNTADFFSKNYDSYLKDENLIKQHDIYYLKFYDELNDDFTGLSFIGKLHLIDTEHNCDIAGYLTKLIKLCNDVEIRTISKICKLFGINLIENK